MVPDCFRTKEVSKRGTRSHSPEPELYPDLYGKLCHKVQRSTNYYPPRGDDRGVG